MQVKPSPGAQNQLALIATLPDGIIQADTIQSRAALSFISELRRLGLLETFSVRTDSTPWLTRFASSSYRITDAGRALLAEMERERENRVKEHAENEAKEQAKEHKAERLRVKDARRSWWQFALGLLLGWILGGFTFKEFLGLFH